MTVGGVTFIFVLRLFDVETGRFLDGIS